MAESKDLRQASAPAANSAVSQGTRFRALFRRIALLLVRYEAQGSADVASCETRLLRARDGSRPGSARARRPVRTLRPTAAQASRRPGCDFVGGALDSRLVAAASGTARSAGNRAASRGRPLLGRRQRCRARAGGRVLGPCAAARELPDRALLLGRLGGLGKIAAVLHATRARPRRAREDRRADRSCTIARRASDGRNTRAQSGAATARLLSGAARGDRGPRPIASATAARRSARQSARSDRRAPGGPFVRARRETGARARAPLRRRDRRRLFLSGRAAARPRILLALEPPIRGRRRATPGPLAARSPPGASSSMFRVIAVTSTTCCSHT